MSEKERSEAVSEAIDEHPDAVIDYHDGEDGAVNFLVGQVLIKLKGHGDPGKIDQEVRDQLEEAEPMEAVARQAFMQGYRKGQDVEDLDAVTVKTSETLFERWWEVNYENE